MDDAEKNERLKMMGKLHRQFVHPSKRRLVALMSDTGEWKKEFEPELNAVYRKC